MKPHPPYHSKQIPSKDREKTSVLGRGGFCALTLGILSLLLFGRLFLLPFFSEASLFFRDKATASNEVIRYGMAKHPPLFFRNDQGNYEGYLADLFRALSEGEPWEAAFVEAPGDELPGMLDRGEADLLSMVHLPHRMYDLGKVHHYATWYTFFTPPGIMIISFLDLEGKRIAMQGGFYGTYELKRILNGLGITYELVETETAQEALELLHRGEADVCSAEQAPSIKLVRRYGFWRSPVIYAPAQIFYAAAEGKHAEILARLDEKLREWHATPLSPLKKIQRRWFYDEEYTFFPEWVRWSFWIAGGIFLSMGLILGTFFWKDKIVQIRNRELRKRMEAERFLREASHELLGKGGGERSLGESCRKLHQILEPQGLLLLGSSAAGDNQRRTLEIYFEALASRDSEKPSFADILRKYPSLVKRLPITLIKELRSKRVLRCSFNDLPFLAGSPLNWNSPESFFSLYPVFEGPHLWGTLVLEHPENPLPPEGTDLLMATFAEVLSAHLLQRREAGRLLRLATTDSLTGLPNRRSFFETLGREVSRSRRHGNPLTLILCDIDFFKEVNDTYGHDVGDRVLREFGQRLRKTLRTEDLPARYGGEEFGVTLPETDLPEAVQIAERLRSLIEEAPFSGGPEKDALPPIHLTASFGVARFEGERDHMEALFSRADFMLYQAKGKGRNTVSPSLELFPPATSI